MKMKYRILYLLLAVPLLAGCYQDDSTLADKTIQRIEVTTPRDTLNIYLGDDIVVSPEIMAANTDVTYQWSIGKYEKRAYDDLEQTKFKDVSSEKDLRYRPDDLGHYHLRLRATNEYGSTIKYFHVFVNTEFEEGYLILGRQDDGHGSLSFMKFLTPEDIAVGVKPHFKTDCFAYVNGDRKIGLDPVDCYKVASSIYITCGQGQRVHQINYKSFQEEYAYDMKTFGSDFVPVKMLAYDSNYNRNLYVFGTDGRTADIQTQYFEVFAWSEVPQDMGFDLVYSRPSYYSSKVILLAKKDEGILYANGFDANEFSFGYFDCYGYFAGNRIIKMFSDYDENVLVYHTDGTNYTLTTVMRSITDFNTMAIRILAERKITDRGILTSDSEILVNDATNGLFFYRDNKVYRWIYGQNDMPQNVFITLPEGEVITAINQNTDHSQLYIGTYNASRTGLKGSFYVYNPDTGAKIEAWEGVSDKPVTVLLKGR